MTTKEVYMSSHSDTKQYWSSKNLKRTLQVNLCMLLHFLLFLPFIILKISQFETIYKDATQHHLFAVVYCWKGIRPVKNRVVGYCNDVVICLERGADLHMVQLMPLPLTVSCSSKIQIGFAFWYRLTQVVLEKRPLNGCSVVVKYKAWSLRDLNLFVLWHLVTIIWEFSSWSSTVCL